VIGMVTAATCSSIPTDIKKSAASPARRRLPV